MILVPHYHDTGCKINRATSLITGGGSVTNRTQNGN